MKGMSAMKKRITSLLLALVLCIGLSAPALAGGVIEGPHCITNAGQIVAFLEESGSGEGWSFDLATNTLTLNGFEGKGLTFCNTTGLTLELADGSVNTLTAPLQMDDTDGVVITGNGTLNIQSNNGSSMVLDDSLTIQSGTITTNERIMVNAPLTVSGGSLTSGGEIYLVATGACTVSGSGTIVVDAPSSAVTTPDPRAIGDPDWTSGLESAAAVDRNGQPLTFQSQGGLMKYTDGAGAVSGYAKITASGAAVPPTEPETPTEEETAPAGAFTDVAADAYYAAPVEWAVAQGITNGTSDTTFDPDETCTRAQIITFLWRAAGSPEPAGAAAFTDVGTDLYYAKAAAWAKENGMASGDTFSPDDPCTREMAVEFMWKHAGSPAAAQAGFTDASSPAVDWAVEKGVTNGTSDTTFSPETICTRGQIVTFLYRGFAQ